MSKSHQKSAQGGTAILCLDADLSAAADAVLALARNHKLSKPALLNILTAQIQGDKHDWGFIKNAKSPVVSKRAHAQLDKILAAISPLEAIEEFDEFTRQCIENAHSVFISVAEGETEIQEAAGEGLFEEGEINAACVEAARRFIKSHYGLPVSTANRDYIQAAGILEAITDVILNQDSWRLYNILQIDERSQARDDADLAADQEEQDIAEQDENLIEQEVAAMRDSVETAAPGTLGEYGRNPGVFMPAKTKIIGYQVWSNSLQRYFFGRRHYEVLSAEVAEGDMKTAKAVGRGDDYAIITIREGDVPMPTFIK